MAAMPLLPLPTDWEPTRATLHNYANAVGALARAHAEPHPKWWHISLEVRPTGLVTNAMTLPDGGTLQLRMDLVQHRVLVEAGDERVESLSMAAGLTGAEFGDALIEIVAGFGLSGEVAREKFASDDPREYDPAHASGFLAALVAIHHNLEIHRSSLDGPVGPLQVWPHGFDLAFEWFGTRTVPHEGGDEAGESPAQLNLGFYPAGRAYFYSNPWPFDPRLTDESLPRPARWHTEGWEGSILYYDNLLATDDPTATLLDYARAVFTVASPSLQSPAAEL
jgi:hypothetical protein